MPVGVSNTTKQVENPKYDGNGVLYTQFKMFQRDVSVTPGNNPGAVLPQMAEQDLSNLLQDGWTIINSNVTRRQEGVDNPHGVVFTLIVLLVK